MRFLLLVIVFFTLTNEAFSATASEAKKYIASLDASLKQTESVLRKGDLKSLHEQSKSINKLQKEGERFGSSGLDKPFGTCFSSGIFAQSWWLARLSTARDGGERIPGEVDDAWRQFQANRKECLLVSEKPIKETVLIQSTSETPPRKGCLQVLGIRPDKQIGVVAYTCSK
jgi:hypothetical protein